MNILASVLFTCSAAALLLTPLGDPMTRPLFDLEDATAINAWRPSHDGVMGGVSTGLPVWTGECVRFSGEVSLENNGGFAAFRSQRAEPLDLSEFDGLRLRVRGDGRNWKVSLRTGQGRNDHNWQAPFKTRKGEGWQEVILPFDVFAPSFHGRYARTAKPLDRANIRSLGLQVADEQAGEYRLDLGSFEAWGPAKEEVAPGTLGAHMRRSESLAAGLEKTASAEALVEALRWSERVVVVSEPLTRGDYGKLASIQRGHLIAALPELAARDLRVVHLLGDRATIVAGQQLGPEATRALRERWGLVKNQWSCVLVGKDGGVKKRWAKPFAPDEAFKIIDVMPMRRDEALDRPGR